MKGNIIVGQSGGPTAAINSSLAGVYRTAIDRGAKKVYGMRHGIQGLLNEDYIDLSEHIQTDLDAHLLPISDHAAISSRRSMRTSLHTIKSFLFSTSLRSSALSISAETIPWIRSKSCPTTRS